MTRNKPFEIDGKVIVITGASSGIGKQCALACSRMGAVVVLVGRDQTRLQQTFSELNAHPQHQIIAVDLTDYSKVEDVFKNAPQSKIDGIIHCAGVSTTLPLRMITPEKLKILLEINVIAAINLTKVLAKSSRISSEGASVVFISSIMGMVGESGKTMYSLSKGALIAGARSLAIELSSKKIRVNSVSPGVVSSPMSNNAVYSQDAVSLEKVTSYHPLGLGSVEDVANGAIFLISDAARWITGTNLTIDGGYTAR